MVITHLNASCLFLQAMDCCPQCLVDYGSLLDDGSASWTASTSQLLEVLTSQRWEPDSARIDRLHDRLQALRAPLHEAEHGEALVSGLSHDDPRVVAATLRLAGSCAAEAWATVMQDGASGMLASVLCFARDGRNNDPGGHCATVVAHIAKTAKNHPDVPQAMILAMHAVARHPVGRAWLTTPGFFEHLSTSLVHDSSHVQATHPL